MDVGRGTKPSSFANTILPSRSQVFIIQLLLKFLLFVLELGPLLLDDADREYTEEGEDREGDDEDGKEGQHVPGEIEQGRVDLPLRGDPPRPVVISVILYPDLHLGSFLLQPHSEPSLL